MSDFEHNDNTISIFKNGYKNKDSQPDYKGSGVIDGKKKQISCWEKETRNGDTFLSCAIQDSYVKPTESQASPEKKYDEAGNELNPNYVEPVINNDFDDDIPF